MMKKNNTKTYYIKNAFITSAIIFSLMMAAIVIITVQLTSQSAIRGVISHDIVTETRSLTADIEWVNHIPHISAHDSDYAGFTYAIVAPDGKVTEGSLPDDLTADMLPKENHTSIDVDTLLNSYLVRRTNLSERRLGSENKSGDSPSPRNNFSRGYTLYGVMNYALVHTQFSRLFTILVVVTFLVAVCIVLITVLLSTRLTKHIKGMTDQAETIINTADYSKPIEISTSFKEIVVLAETCNHLLKKADNIIFQQKRFNNDVSHELRTPITVLRAQCQLAMDQMKDDEEAMKILEVIDRQTNRMNALIKKLLELSQIEQNKVYTEAEPVNISDIIESVCEDISIVTDRNNLFDIDTENVIINANTELILTMLRNLIENAVKYGGEKAPVKISLSNDNSGIYIRICDQGIGMSPEEVTHAFDLFFRADNARNSEGFGLGLTLADRIVKMYGGRIEIKSDINIGSTFTVILPTELLDVTA